MPYWQLFYHFIWTTHGRERWIQRARQAKIYELFQAKAKGQGASVFALNGIEDHVHLVCSIPPKIAVASFVGQVKGVSSARINQLDLLGHKFAWQAEYGVFSFDKKRLPKIIAYVQNQEEHHRRGTILSPLERTGSRS